MTARRRDQALILAALVGVAVLVGMAVRPGSTGGSAALPTEPLVVASQTAVWLLLAADVLFTLAIIDALISQRRMKEPGRRRRWTETLATYLIGMMPTILALVLLLYVRRPNGQALIRLPGGGGFGLGGFGPVSHTTGATGSATTTWLGLLFAALIVILFLGWLLWPSPRLRPALRPKLDRAMEEDVAAAVDESLDTLRAIPDPRQAIIAAYSSMEGSMARAGMPRRHSEAPMEFVTRVLGALVGMSADLSRLTDLFEVAKFSDHPIDESMRAEAIVALSGIRERLVAAPVPA